MASEDGQADGSAWERTIAELRLLEEELAADGWAVVAVPAGHVAPESPAAGETDRFGLVYVVPGDEADAFRRAFDTGSFEEYEVFRRRVGGRLFLVTKLTDPNQDIAVLLAGGVDLSQADALVRAAATRGVLYTHVQTLDRTHLGSFRHDDPTLFFGELPDNVE